MWPASLPEYKKNFLNLTETILGCMMKISAVLGFDFLKTCISRALDYESIKHEDNYINPFWCGEHRDHGFLTGLCPASYFQGENLIDEPEGSGLYINNKHVIIPNDCVLFQVGEAAELITNGKWKATLHRVNKAFNCKRYTMAVFSDVEDDFIIDSDVTSEYLMNRYTKRPMKYSEWSEASYNLYKNSQ
jgi:isopenicillin N synthase-like dioxygenase